MYIYVFYQKCIALYCSLFRRTSAIKNSLQYSQSSHISLIAVISSVTLPFWLNWNLKMLVFLDRTEKLEYPERNPKVFTKALSYPHYTSMVNCFNIGHVDTTQEEFKNVFCPNKKEKLVFSNSSYSKSINFWKNSDCFCYGFKCGWCAFPHDLYQYTSHVLVKISLSLISSTHLHEGRILDRSCHSNME